MMLSVSVIVCTHNPDTGCLQKVLQALMAQTLPRDKWELLLIDNASDTPAAAAIDGCLELSVRVIREEKLGLTNARLRGIAESVGELLVFVDDDNILDEDYLDQSLRIATCWPSIGAWGGGIRPLFAESPPEWTKQFWPMLAIRPVSKSVWSNFTNNFDSVPCGAGLSVRRIVAREYAKRLQDDPVRVRLDRVGTELSSCGDSDLAFTACDMGYGTGIFKELQLTHIIPRWRLSERYLLSLVESMQRSHVILAALRGDIYSGRISIGSKVLNLIRLLKQTPLERRFSAARDRGSEAGRAAVKAVGYECSRHKSVTLQMKSQEHTCNVKAPERVIAPQAHLKL